MERNSFIDGSIIRCTEIVVRGNVVFMDGRPPLESFFKKKSPIQIEDIDDDSEMEIKFLRGKRGPKGEDGKDAILPSKEEITALLKPFIPEPIPGINGKDGHTPTTKELLPLISNLIPQVKDGKTPSEEELLELIAPLIPEPLPAPTAEPEEISGRAVIDKINKSTTKEKIKRSKVEGFDEIENTVRNNSRQVQSILSLGGSRSTAIKVSGTLLGRGIETLNFVGATGTKIGDGSEVNITTSGGGTGTVNTIVAGTGISVDSTDPANPIVTSTVAAFAGSQEKSTTVPNGVLTTFAFTHTPRVIFWNGAFQTLTDDYTVSSNNITFTASAGIPQTGDKVVNLYA